LQNNTFSALFVGQNIVKLTEVDSTNNYLKKMLSNYAPLAEGTVIMADHQLAGRGQFGNTWHSQKGENLTISIYLSPSFLPATQQFDLSKAISLAIIDYLTHFFREDCKIKWPNDIYVGNDKLGGLLIENTISSGKIKNSIIGIGLNVNQTEFDGLSHANSMKNILGKALDLHILLKELCNCVEQRYLQLKDNKTEILHKQYLEKLFRMNEMAGFIVGGEKVSGKIVNVSSSGALMVDMNGQVKSFNFKEIGFVM
jgi:BirA family biotin operon repressor/biotin-[acetyl-CoA-carboxylase] ligase